MFGMQVDPQSQNQWFGGQQQPQLQMTSMNTNNRFIPNFPSLNTQADGKIVCINMTTSDIQKSRIESRIEFIRAGKAMSNIQPQQQLQQQPMFNVQAQQPNFAQGFQQQPQNPVQQPVSSGGLFGQPSSGLFGQPQQPNQSTQFTFSGQPQQTGGLFGTAPQIQPQQQSVSLFGGLGIQQNQQPQSNLLQQIQQPLFSQQPQQPGCQLQQTPSVISASQLPQLPQGYKYAIIPVEEVQQHIDIDIDALQQQHIEEMEQNLMFNSYPLNYGSDDFNQSKSKQQKLPRYCQIQQKQQSQVFPLSQKMTMSQRSQQMQQCKNQYKSLAQRSMIIQDKLSQDHQISFKMNQQVLQQMQKGFLLISPQSRPPIKQYVKFADLEISSDNLQDITVQQLILQIQDIFLNEHDSDKNYFAIFSSNGNPQNQVGLGHDLTLDNLEFSNKSTISIFPQLTHESSLSRSSIQSKNKISFTEKSSHQKIKNPNAPQIIKKEGFETIPLIQNLEYLSDQELSQVKDFEIHTEFGSVKFLKPVDLRCLILDSIIDFNQDSIEFYPEDRNHETPIPGKEINVPCIITFNNFGNADIQLRDLKLKNYQEFVETVKQQVIEMNMKFIYIDKQKLVVELQAV